MALLGAEKYFLIRADGQPWSKRRAGGILSITAKVSLGLLRSVLYTAAYTARRRVTFWPNLSAAHRFSMNSGNGFQGRRAGSAHVVRRLPTTRPTPIPGRFARNKCAIWTRWRSKTPITRGPLVIVIATCWTPYYPAIVNYEYMTSTPEKGTLGCTLGTEYLDLDLA